MKLVLSTLEMLHGNQYRNNIATTSMSLIEVLCHIFGTLFGLCVYNLCDLAMKIHGNVYKLPLAFYTDVKTSVSFQ